jgi:hypothetical protein
VNVDLISLMQNCNYREDTGIIITEKSGNCLEMKEQNMCNFKDTVYILMINQKVMLIIKPNKTIRVNTEKMNEKKVI